MGRGFARLMFSLGCDSFAICHCVHYHCGYDCDVALDGCSCAAGDSGCGYARACSQALSGIERST